MDGDENHVMSKRWIWESLSELWHRQAIALVLGMLTLVIGGAGRVAAQEGGPAALRLSDAIALARKNLPAIEEARARVGAATAKEEMARLSYLPKAELDWQQTRGTRNNIFGQFFPQSAIPPISGPVIGEPAFGESAWGSGGGLIVTWEPFDFGQRQAERMLAGRIVAEAEASLALTEMEAALGAADAFLRAAAAAEVVRAAEANVARMETFAQMVQTLVSNELRPGADGSRVEVELATAQNRLIDARERAELALVTLSASIGLAGEAVRIDVAELEADRSGGSPREGETGRSQIHPLLLLRQSSAAISLARQELLERSFRPRFQWQTALFARGTGARIDGRILGTRGLFPDTPNWATGLLISFAPTDLFRWRVARREEERVRAAEEARVAAARQSLQADEARARALHTSAEAYRALAPRQLSAARETELRVRKRYEAELGTVSEVAEAMRLVAQAEVDAALAQLSRWRARVAESRARGDLSILLSPNGGTR